MPDTSAVRGYALAVTLRHVAKLAVWTAACLAIPVVTFTIFGRRGAWLGILASVVASLYITLWLPRLAHAAFETGNFVKAARRYRAAHLLAFGRRRERAALLSRAACKVAANDAVAAEAILAAIEPTLLDNSERVVFLNNRACALLDGPSADPNAALALVEEASSLRPDVPAVQHTRARALLAVGRIDEAITVLDNMRAGGELPARLESERCRDLALAWERKGQADYADDYRNRARLHAAS